MQTPRAIKTLVIAAALIGQLFTSGYFFNSKDTQPISEDLAQYCQKAMIVGLAASLLVIPLKIIISVFLSGIELKEKAKKKEIEEAERKQPTFRLIGYVLIGFWLVGSGYAISMFAVNFNLIALGKWQLAFFTSFLIDVIIIFNLKMFFKVILALILMSLARFEIMLTVAGLIVSHVVDAVMFLT